MTTRIGRKQLAAAAAALLFSGVSYGQNWLTDGGDTVRSGWQKDEHTLTKENVKGLKLLWTIKTDVQPHALHSLMTPLVVEDVPTSSGKKEMVYVLGVSDELYAIDTATHKIAWEKHFTYAALPPRQQGPPPEAAPGSAAPGGPARNTPGAAAAPGAGGAAQPAAGARAGAPARPAGAPGGSDMRGSTTEPKHFNFLNPNGSTDVPVIGPANAQGIRPIYVVDGGGNLHTLSDVTGEDMNPTVGMGVQSKFALQLYKDSIIFGYSGGIISASVGGGMSTITKSTGFGRSGGLWGRRGPAIDSQGIVWTTTGDGQYDAEKNMLANSIVGFEMKDGAWHVKDWFTPPNWAWLWHRDLDPNNTPTIFNFKGKELMAASGKECRVYLLDPKNAGGSTHMEPLYKTPLICNEAVDFQNAGSWGALSSWEDPSGTRWVIVPFWGPAHSKFKFPITNTPETKEGGEAAFKVVDKNGKPELEPVWVSRDMHRGEPPVIADGMIFAYGSGENTQQAWADIGLNFDSTIRASKGERAVIYVLDAMTGKELWTSGDQIAGFNHFSALTVSNGKLYLGTYDGNLYCFGL
jgi:outer membrane protein assembly factor BamB